MVGVNITAEDIRAGAYVYSVAATMVIGVLVGVIVYLYKRGEAIQAARAADAVTCRECKATMVEKYEKLLQVNLGVIERNTTSLDLQTQIREAAGYDRSSKRERSVR